MTRPEVLKGITPKVRTGCGNCYITLNYDGPNMYETFFNLGKAGGCVPAMTEAIGKLASLALQHGAKPEDVVHRLIGIHCPLPVIVSGEECTSCVDAFARTIKKVMEGAYDDSLRAASIPLEKDTLSEIIQKQKEGLTRGQEPTSKPTDPQGDKLREAIEGAQNHKRGE